MSRWSKTALAEGRYAPSWGQRQEYTEFGPFGDGAWTMHGRPRYQLPAQNGGRGEPEAAGMAMLASAALVSKQQVRSVMGRKEQWQRQAWDLFNDAPELRFGVSWAANACSRARLYVGRIDPDGSSDPTPINVPEDADSGQTTPADGSDFEESGMSEEEIAKTRLLLAPLDELAGGRVRQARMVKRVATQLNIVGESYLIGFDDPQTRQRRWLVCSSSEVQPFGHSIKIMSPEVPGQDIEIPISQATILRTWRPHDEIAHQADSPVRALRSTLQELMDLSAHIRATAESRLAGAGLLFVPEELSIPNPQQSQNANPLHSDPFMDSLIEAMAAPLKNRDSASAIVPLVVRGPAEAGDKMKHLSFATPFDERVAEMRASAIRRVATGLDMPPEILTGLGDSNHWSAWALEESAIKLHVEPLLGLICDSLTTHFYQPALRALGVADWRDYAIWYSTSDLALRPNRGPEASEAYAKGAISEATYRREIGFGDQDAPTDNERAARLADHVVRTNANLAPILLPRLGIPLSDKEREDADPQGTPAPMGAVKNTSKTPGAAAAPPGAAGAAGARAEIPQQRAAASMASVASIENPWRISCLDMAVRRALTRVGQHLLRSTSRTYRVELQSIPLMMLHTRLRPEEGQVSHMLSGAYSEFVESTPGETCLHEAVDAYVRALLAAGEEHRVEYLQRAIAQRGCE